MKQKNIQFSFNAEKLGAVEMYLEEKGESLEHELGDYMDVLFKKHVPANVRDYIDLRGNNVKTKPQTK